MKVRCIGCEAELEATEELKKCLCGLVYGLTPFFPYSEEQLKKKWKKRKK